MGLVFLAAQWSADHPGAGLASFLLMAVTAAIFAFGGRSETIRGLRGDGHDERFAGSTSRRRRSPGRPSSP
jgi:hypothetical protein